MRPFRHIVTHAALALAALTLGAAAASAHDVWVQTNTNIVRVGDVVHVDLMLGNHGNDHRDFKLASKLPLTTGTFQLVSPDGKVRDLKPDAADLGYDEKEGFWSTRVVTGQPGLYTAVHHSDQVVFYAPKRSVKSAKTMFVASKSLDKVSEDNPGFDRVFGHALELVPVSNPVTPMGPGEPIEVKLLYKGKPLADTKVSCIPRGATLKDGFDDKYERKTDEHGVARFEPTSGNYYLIVAHHKTDESGTLGDKKYDFTLYGATLCVYVPQLCPCCGG